MWGTKSPVVILTFLLLRVTTRLLDGKKWSMRYTPLAEKSHRNFGMLAEFESPALNQVVICLATVPLAWRCREN